MGPKITKHLNRPKVKMHDKRGENDADQIWERIFKTDDGD